MQVDKSNNILLDTNIVRRFLENNQITEQLLKTMQMMDMNL